MFHSVTRTVALAVTEMLKLVATPARKAVNCISRPLKVLQLPATNFTLKLLKLDPCYC